MTGNTNLTDEKISAARDIFVEAKTTTTISAIAANTTGHAIINVEKDGYTPLGIMGFYGASNSGLLVQEYQIAVRNGHISADICVKNTTSASITPTRYTALILYKKN